MKISVITIAFNSAATIEATLQSVAGQDYPDIEYIVIDGGSTDATPEIIGRYRHRINCLISEKDRGIYDAMNKGVAHATGDIVAILNSDDFYSDNRVLSDVARIFDSQSCDAVYGDLVYVDREHVDTILRTWKAGTYRPGLFRQGWMPPHPTFFVRRSCYTKFGDYTLELRSAADYELMLRFIHKNMIRLAYLPRVLVKMRAGGQSNKSLKNRVRANREDRKAWTMNGLVPAWYTLSWKPVRKIFQFLQKG